MATAASDVGLPTAARSTPDRPRTGPTADRVVALYFVRGAALFGTLLMNITGLPPMQRAPLAGSRLGTSS